MQAGERAFNLNSRYSRWQQKLQPTGLKLLIIQRTCISKKASESVIGLTRTGFIRRLLANWDAIGWPIHCHGGTFPLHCT